jgi:hypothetical protein
MVALSRYRLKIFICVRYRPGCPEVQPSPERSGLLMAAPTGGRLRSLLHRCPVVSFTLMVIPGPVVAHVSSTVTGVRHAWRSVHVIWCPAVGPGSLFERYQSGTA